jgi:multidrug efflux pump subunit AcrA (membrane-fusion protein)
VDEAAAGDSTMSEPSRTAGNRQVAAAAMLAALLLAGCGQSNTYVTPPPPKVTVAKPVKRSVTHYLEATGNAAAVNTADLVARVSGFVESIGYKDGDTVKKGAVLFTIEPESYELKVSQSRSARPRSSGRP